MAFCFHKATYRVNIFIGVTPSTLLSVASLHHMGASPNLTNKDFLPLAWKESVQLIKSLQLQTPNLKVVNKEGLVSLFY